METNLSLIKVLIDLSIRKLCCLYNIVYNESTIDQIINNEQLLFSINKKILSNNIFRTREFKSILQFYVFRNTLYFLIRETKPEIVIETGVFHGLTSAWILQALKDNNRGKLYSIDLPRRDWSKFMGSRAFGPGAEHEESELGEEDPGWIVPNHLKDRWELILGPSETELEKICNKLDNVDLFIHDSDHSYKTMKFECDYIMKSYPKAKIVIDDFFLNSYTYELLSKNICTGILMDDLDPNDKVFPSTAFLTKPN